jgi:hypothetical protein
MRADQKSGLHGEVKLDGPLVILGAHIVVAFSHSEGVIKQTLTHSSMILPARPKRTNLPDEPVYFGCDDGNAYALKGTAGLAVAPWPKDRQNTQNTGSAQEYFKSLPRFNPALTRFTRDGFSLSLESGVGKPFQIEWTSDWRVWTPLQVFTNATGNLTITDRDAVSSPFRFYRARSK